MSAMPAHSPTHWDILVAEHMLDNVLTIVNIFFGIMLVILILSVVHLIRKVYGDCVLKVGDNCSFIF